MQYRLDKYGNELSVLGFGCLRFPQKNGKIDMDATREQIAAITSKTDIKILVTLSCTMCPDLVVATQRIAAVNSNVTASSALLFPGLILVISAVV